MYAQVDSSRAEIGISPDRSLAYSSLPARMPFTMKSWSTPYSLLRRHVAEGRPGDSTHRIPPMSDSRSLFVARLSGGKWPYSEPLSKLRLLGREFLVAKDPLACRSASRSMRVKTVALGHCPGGAGLRSDGPSGAGCSAAGGGGYRPTRPAGGHVHPPVTGWKTSATRPRLAAAKNRRSGGRACRRS